MVGYNVEPETDVLPFPWPDCRSVLCCSLQIVFVWTVSVGVLTVGLVNIYVRSFWVHTCNMRNTSCPPTHTQLPNHTAPKSLYAIVASACFCSRAPRYCVASLQWSWSVWNSWPTGRSRGAKRLMMLGTCGMSEAVTMLKQGLTPTTAHRKSQMINRNIVSD